MIVHIVLFKFKEKHKEQNIKKAIELLEQLPQKIEQLISIEIGVDFDNTSRAMDLSIYTKFATKEDLNIYATCEEHLKVVEFIKQVTEYSKVVDYEKCH